MPKRSDVSRVEAPVQSGVDLVALARLLGEQLGKPVVTEFHRPGAWPGLEDQALVCAYHENADGRLVLGGLLVLGDAVTAESLRAVSISKLEEAVNLARATAEGSPGATGGADSRSWLIVPHFQLSDGSAPVRPVLRRTAELTPDQFSQRVAEEYKAWAMRVPNPAKAMSDANGVKLPTVHSWIREARLRGYLPPGRRGKA